MAESPIVVVGAGLAGLACARDLTRAGRTVVVLEGTDRVGGRVRTDLIDGFRIDRGFQVINTAYPALRTYLNSLEVRAFPRGVRVRRAGVSHAVPHPLSSPRAALAAASSGATDLPGKLALGRYVAGLLATSPERIKRRPDVAAVDAWRERLPERVVTEVMMPFLAGVVLDPEVRTSRVFTDLMMRLFALGESAVPARGMARLPEVIAEQLPPGTIRLATPVAAASRDSVQLADGSEIGAAAVVIATDPWAAEELVPDLPQPTATRGVTTYYFAAEPWAGQGGELCVDADRSGVANSVILTASAPEYSSDGRSLIATSVFDRGVDSGAAETVARDLHAAPDAPWELVATRHVPQALPAMPAPLTLRKQTWFPQVGLWVAGDHRDTSSIQGALASGSRVATAVRTALEVA